MNERWIYGVFGVLAIGAGVHNFVTGTGSLIFGVHATTVYNMPHLHYSGIWAYLEGAAFIATGIYCLFRAWRGKGDAEDE